MSNLILGWPNRFTTGTITNSGQYANLPATNLANDQGGADQAWQFVSGGGTVTVGLDAGTTTYRVFSLHRTNLSLAAVWQVRVWSDLNTASPPVYDSGLLSCAIKPGYGQCVLVAPATVTGRLVGVDVRDIANPDGFVNIPLAYAGPAWQPVRNADWETSNGRTGQSSNVITRSGAVITRNDWTKRTHNLSLSAVMGAEVWPQLMSLDLYARRGNNVLVVPDPASSLRNYETVYGQLEPSGPVNYTASTVDRRGYKATITERL